VHVLFTVFPISDTYHLLLTRNLECHWTLIIVFELCNVQIDQEWLARLRLFVWHVRVLFYADDMKLFLPVRGFWDCLKIQIDLNRLVEWCEANALELNVAKCNLITFARLRHPIKISYKLGGIILYRVDSVNDLGVIMDSKAFLLSKLMLRLEGLWECLGLWRGCRVSLGTPILLRPFMFPLCTQNLNTPVVCGLLWCTHR
jgi:hypothetical protein